MYRFPCRFVEGKTFLFGISLKVKNQDWYFSPCHCRHFQIYYQSFSVCLENGSLKTFGDGKRILLFGAYRRDCSYCAFS